MADVKLTGAGVVQDTDYKYIKYVGKTKAGNAITIEVENAFCRSNPDWTFAEKDDVVPEIEFEGCYDDEKLDKDDRTEPWTLTRPNDLKAGNGEIVLGVGKFYVGTNSTDAKCVGLTRGGGSFTVEREYREINADGDPGAVKGRMEQNTGRPKMKFKAMQWLTKVADLYAGMKTVTEQAKQ